MECLWRKRRNFHRQPVAPSIFAIGNCSDLAPKVVIGVAVVIGVPILQHPVDTD